MANRCEDIAHDSEDDEDNTLTDLFREPDGYLPPDKPYTHVAIQLSSGQEVAVRLVGSSPLWGHLLWNAARTMTSYLIENAASVVIGRTILELGAGAGLPSLVCGSLGAEKVVVTDYPDPALIENLQFNIDSCMLLSAKQKRDTIFAQGHLWGAAVQPLIDPLGLPRVVGADVATNCFDTILLADVLFNHPTHGSLLQTVTCTLSRKADARVLVFFTPHRPWLLEKDLAFFNLATTSGLAVRRIVEHWYDDTIFEGEGKWEGRRPPLDWQENQPAQQDDVRRVVWGYEMAWANLVDWP